MNSGRERAGNRSSGVQEFRSSGVQEFRSSGVQELFAVRKKPWKVKSFFFWKKFYHLEKTPNSES